MVKFVGFVSYLATRADEVARIASRALADTARPDDPKASHYKQTAERGAGAIEALHRHRQLLLEMTLCRAVDNYLTYISQLLALVFMKKPETLRTAEQVRVDFVLRFETRPELIAALVERRVNALSYQGMDDLSTEVSERLGLDIFPSDTLRKTVIRLIELRNVIVHNRGVVNATFVRRFPEAAKDCAHCEPALSRSEFSAPGSTRGGAAIANCT